MTTETIALREATTLPAGFLAAGTAAGIKKAGAKDMALFLAEGPAVAAGVFTTNQVQAASVKLCRERLAVPSARAIVVNSGVANACTGTQGRKDAEQMADWAAEALQCAPAEVLVCSTGHIGVPLPMKEVGAGIRTLATAAAPGGGRDAAEAIMTTDTRPKYATTTITLEGRAITVTGIAKGSGMIEPDMATMLAFLLTDAAVEPAALQAALAAAVNLSFNRISVDGDQSTNDTVLALANGAAGNAPLSEQAPGWPTFTAALAALTHDLAMKIMRDGEGVTKVVTIQVSGARSDAEADLAARSVGNSLLVKTSWVGSFPNWGRVMDALGYSAAKVTEELVDIYYDQLPATLRGKAADTPLDALKAVVAGDRFTLGIHLNLGDGAAVVYSCDCTEEYVRINR